MTPRRDDGDDAANDSVWVDTFMMLHLGMACMMFFFMIFCDEHSMRRVLLII